jgi:hypothetical protein
LGRSSPRIDPDLLAVAGHMGDDLIGLLSEKNGFYAFESALHVFSTHPNESEIGLNAWNAPELWINEYRGMVSRALFFAENVFGDQFCMKGDGIYNFDPETGKSEKLSDDLEGWAGAILRNYKVLTGYPLAHEWQKANGRLLPGQRLIPKVPFVAGGKFSVPNLFALESLKAMRFRSNIAAQIEGLPEGVPIRFRIAD